MCGKCVTRLAIGRPTNTSQERALENDGDRRQVEGNRQAMRAMQRAGGSIRSRVLAAVAQQASPVDVNRVLVDAMQLAVPVIRRAGVVSDLYGRRRVDIRTTQEVGTQREMAAARMPKIQLATYNETVGFLRRRLGLSSGQIGLLTERYGNVASGAVNGATATVNRFVQEALADIVDLGLFGQDAVARVSAAMSRAGLGAGTPPLVETLYRTQTAVAYTAGRLNVNDTNPFVRDNLWGYEYVSAGDDRVRPTHDALDGTRLPADDPFWSRFQPPNGYNCRCDTIEIFNTQRRITSAVNPPQMTRSDGQEIPVQPDPGFSFSPGNVYRDILGTVA